MSAAASRHDRAPTIRPANRDGWLTDEQRLAVEQAMTGLPLKVEAGAGTGKTTTLVAISKALVGTGRCRRGLYLASIAPSPSRRARSCHPRSSRGRPTRSPTGRSATASATGSAA